MRAVGRFILVELKKESSNTTKTKSGLYVLNTAKLDTTKDGDQVNTQSVEVIDIGPDAKVDVKVGDHVALNYYNLQILPEREGHIYGVIEDTEIKVVY